MFPKLYTLPLLALISLFSCTATTSNAANEELQQSNSVAIVDTKADSTKSTEKIKWLTIEQAAERMKKEPRKILIDVYTDWCGWCKKMDKETFTDPQVAALVNQHFYAVKFDAEGTEPVTFKSHTFVYKPEYKAHELAVALMNGQMSYPTTVYLDEKLDMLSPVPGYLDAKSMTQILTYFGKNHHQNMSWKEFEKNPK